MKIMIIGQDPLKVTSTEAQAIIQSIRSGAEYVIVGDEYIKSSVITGVRDDYTGKSLEASLWGALPASSMRNFFDDRREPKGDGYKKFQEMKRKMLAKKR